MRVEIEGVVVHIVRKIDFDEEIDEGRFVSEVARGRSVEEAIMACVEKEILHEMNGDDDFSIDIEDHGEIHISL